MKVIRTLSSKLLPFLLLLAAACLMACGTGEQRGEPITPVGDEFRIDASSIGAGDVKFFSYPVGGKTVTFLVARAADGEIRTAFDACITCYPYKKGYRYEAGRIVCIQCGTKFGLDELGTGKGNCVPIAIEHHMEGSIVVIRRAAVEAGSCWF